MSASPTPTQPAKLTGIDIMRGVGLSRAKGFWADAWSRIIRRRGAIFGLVWISIVAFFAVVAPFIANGHPLLMRELGPGGEVVRTTSPLIEFLKPSDILILTAVMSLLVWLVGPTGRAARAASVVAVMMSLAAVGVITAGLFTEGWVATGERKLQLLTPAVIGFLAAGWSVPKPKRFLAMLMAMAQCLVTLILVSIMLTRLSQRDLSEDMLAIKLSAYTPLAVPAIAAAIAGGLALLVPWTREILSRLGVVVAALALAAAIGTTTWSRPQLEAYQELDREIAGEVQSTYTLVPWSPNQRFSELNRVEPGTVFGEAMKLPKASPAYERTFILGTDALGTDVLTQMLHACRLSISIGLVSTGISLLIGITLGALMGYFGGWVDLVLYRVVEVFMAVPVLFLLIVAVAVLPDELRSTYTLMAIIGCFSWTGAARFTRAEFLKLRNQDFVQSAKAVGLPLHTILFKHMLPNGVTPVLVDASFSIAAAILAEATLSYLGLGPVDQPSWGKLLSSAANSEGVFKWWLAVFPGAAIFMTVLSYNLIGEAARDAIDPKLRKAAH